MKKIGSKVRSCV